MLAIGALRPPSATVQVEFAARSHAGRSQTHNEDHYLIQALGRTQRTLSTSLPAADLPGPFEEYAYVMLVADGVGGKGPGALASRVALSTLAHLALHFGQWNVRVDEQTAADIVERAEWFYQQTHDVLREKGLNRAETAGMATSLTAAYSAGDELFVAHVGHTRAYMFRTGELVQLTHDQTVASRFAEAVRPTPVAVESDDLRHILTDTIGGSNANPEVEISRHRLVHGDCVLLCTDGLSDLVSDDGIAEVLTLRRSLDEQCTRLIDLALDRGGTDNVTVVLAQYNIPPEPDGGRYQLDEPGGG
jgi:PPM family protein phosphatase